MNKPSTKGGWAGAVSFEADSQGIDSFEGYFFAGKPFRATEKAKITLRSALEIALKQL